MLKCKIIPVTHYQQNSSLIWCSDTLEAALVYPGGDVELIEQTVQQEGVTITKILLTHGHLDHVGGAVALSQKYSVKILGPHADDIYWLSRIPEQAQRMGFPPANSFEPSVYFNQGDTVNVGKLELEIFHCPGHTPGHIVFFNRESKIAWVGDVLFKGSIGRTDFPNGNYDDLISSIKNNLWPLGDEVRFIPGHGPMSTFGHERQTNPFVADKRFG